MQNMICSFTIKAETRDRLKSKKNDDKINKPNDLQPKQIMLRHVIISSRAFTIEQLAEKSLRSPLRTVKTEVNVICTYSVTCFLYVHRDTRTDLNKTTRVAKLGVKRSRSSFQGGDLIFTGAGEIAFDAYKEWYVSWGPAAKIKVCETCTYVQPCANIFFA